MLNGGCPKIWSHMRKCLKVALTITAMVVAPTIGNMNPAGAQSLPTIPPFESSTTTAPDSNSEANQPNGPESGLTVSPALIDNTVNPGTTFAVPITISNITDRAVPIDVSKGKLETSQQPDGKDGKDGKIVSQYDISPWFTVDTSSLLLRERDQATVNVTVSVPPNAEPGGHYGTVFFAALATDLSGGASGQTLLNARVGVVFLVTVRGEVKAGAELDGGIRTKTAQWDAGITTFQFGLKNTGNVHFAPSGSLVVKDLFGRKVKEIPLEQGVVLPGASKQYEIAWERGVRPGIYTAEVKVAAGIDLQAKSKRFVLAPLVLLIPALLILLVVALGILGALRRRKRRRKRQQVIEAFMEPEPGEIIDEVGVPRADE